MSYVRRRARRFTALVLLLAISAISCDHDDEDDDVVYQPPDTTMPQAGPDDGCPEAHPHRLELSTRDPREVEYLDDITACTDPDETETLLVNHSDVVWTLTTSGDSANVAQLTDSLRLASFRELSTSVYRYPLLAPDSTVRVDAAPSTVEWTLAPGLSVSWLLHEKFVDTIKSYGEAQLTDMLSGTSSRRRALVTCSIAGYNVAGEAAQALNGTNPLEQLMAGVGIAADATACAAAWQRADADATRVFNKTATWGDDVAKWSHDLSFVTKTNARLKFLNQVGKLVMRRKI